MSPFLLNATIEQHLLKYSDEHPELVQKILNSLYVDDLNSGCTTAEEAFDLFVKSKKIMSQGVLTSANGVLTHKNLEV